EFLDRIFVASCSTEIGIVDQHIFRVLLDNIIISNTFLSDCLSASYSTNTSRSVSTSTDLLQKQHSSASRQQSGSLSAQKYNLELKSDFCAYVIRQVGVVL
ncbi:unnamed protein product, partial [Onchocerca flexuosa]|uniref:Ras-GAP domain-containing protein n=1 Tax=Onchocerca flexuosa TaxID=387005 RepID=A0A183HVN7_9BILA